MSEVWMLYSLTCPFGFFRDKLRAIEVGIELMKKEVGEPSVEDRGNEVCIYNQTEGRFPVYHKLFVARMYWEMDCCEDETKS